MDIQTLELYPILALVHTFAGKLAGKRIIMHCDNEALVFILNKQTSTSPSVMQLLLLLTHRINFRACHIPGALNMIAENLSSSHVTPDMLSSYGMNR